MLLLPLRVRVGLEVDLAPAPVGDVRVELGRAQVGVAEHLLDAAQVGAALEQMRRERVPQQVRVDAPGLEPGGLGEPAQDQERARAGERAALGVQEELGPVAAVEVGPAAREVAAERLDRLASDAGRPAPCRPCRCTRTTPVVEVDAVLLEPDRLRDAQARRRRAARRAPGRAARAASSPLAASISRSASPAESVRGSCRVRRGSATSAAGLSLARADQLEVAEEACAPPRCAGRASPARARRRAAAAV